MSVTDGKLPGDAFGNLAAGGYSPNVGVVPLATAAPTSDGQAQPSAALIVAQATASNLNVTASQAAAYPTGATPITAASGDVAAATAAATLASVAGKTTYITGFSFTSTGSTAAATVDITVTNTITGTLTFVYVSVAGATTANAQLLVTFPYPIPASAANTTIVVSAPSLGAGNLHAAMNAYGFQL